MRHLAAWLLTQSVRLALGCKLRLFRSGSPRQPAPRLGRPKLLVLEDRIAPNGSPTTTLMTCNPSPATYGQVVALTAIVSCTDGGTPTGTVEFWDGGTDLGQGTLALSGGGGGGVGIGGGGGGYDEATLRVNTLSAGTHNLTAIYDGDPTYSGSASSVCTESVNKANANISVSPYSVTYDTNSHTALATATGVAGVNLNSELDLSGTTHTEAGTYADTWTFTDLTGNYNNASDTVTDTIAQASTNTQPGTSGTMLGVGQNLTLSATVSAIAPGGGTPAGTVTFTDGSITLGTATLSGGTASLAIAAGLAAGTHSIGITYGGISDFVSSNSSQTLIVADPADDPMEPTVNCGCPNSPGSVVQLNWPDMGPAVSSSSSDPVRYGDGTVTIAETDVYSAGFGFPWAQTRSWTNAAGYAQSGVNGVGWVDTYLPQLIRADGQTTTTLIIINNGTSSSYFDFDPDTDSYQGQFADPPQLTYDSSNDTYSVVDGRGDQVIFTGFSTTRPAAERGAFASYTDWTGQTIAVTSYTTDGHVGEVQRTAPSGADTVTESYVYSYLPGTDPNGGLLDNVTLRRQVDSGEWTTVQQVNYLYYNGTQHGGNLGDLMTATVEDASGAVLSTSYYRYYGAGEANGYQHALKFAVNPASYLRMTGALGTNLNSLSDAQVAEYADYAFQYDVKGRVTQEVVQGGGSSTDDGGLGTYTYSYTASSNSPGENSWAMKTIETSPDGSTDTVYTNAHGQIMLKDHYDPTSAVDTVEFYVYNASGQIILSAAPSAVSGYNDLYADLLHDVAGTYAYLNDSSGLITRYDYYTTTNAGGSMAGAVAGYEEEKRIQQGQDGTLIVSVR